MNILVRMRKPIGALAIAAAILTTAVPAGAHEGVTVYGGGYHCLYAYNYAEVDGSDYFYASTKATYDQFGTDCYEPYVAIYNNSTAIYGSCAPDGSGSMTKVKSAARSDGTAATYWYTNFATKDNVCTYHATKSRDRNKPYSMAMDIHFHS